MPATTHPPPARTDAPDDPVRAALEDPAVRDKLTAAALALFRGRHADASDVVQEAFARAWKARGKYEPGRSVTAWLRGFVANVALETRRKRMPLAPDETDFDGRADPFRTVEEIVELRDWLMVSLDKLPAADAAVLRLRHIEGHDYPEIAAKLGLSRPAARQRVSRALLNARDIMKGDRS